MAKEERIAELNEHVADLRRCCLSNVPDDLAIDQIDGWARESDDMWAEYEDAILFLARSATFDAPMWAVLESWADTTGHGCQCGAAISFHESRALACRLGLSDKGRALLGLDVDGNALDAAAKGGA